MSYLKTLTFRNPGGRAGQCGLKVVSQYFNTVN